jgi:hypothetical protein
MKWFVLPYSILYVLTGEPVLGARFCIASREILTESERFERAVDLMLDRLGPSAGDDAARAEIFELIEKRRQCLSRYRMEIICSVTTLPNKEFAELRFTYRAPFWLPVPALLNKIWWPMPTLLNTYHYTISSHQKK